MSEASDILGAIVGSRQPAQEKQNAFVGRTDGTISVSGRAGFIFVRKTFDSDSGMLRVYNDRIPASALLADIPVIIGRDPAQPDLWKVLDIQRDDAGVRTVTFTDFNGNPVDVPLNSIAGFSTLLPDGEVALGQPGSGLKSGPGLRFDSDFHILYVGDGTKDFSSVIITSEDLPRFQAAAYSATSPATFLAYRARGTRAAPTAAQSGDVLIDIQSRGYGSSAFGATSGEITSSASENHTNTNHGTQLDFYVTPNAGGALTNALRILNDGTTAPLLAFAILGDISPAQITADQNNYNPTGLSGASVLRLNTDASRNITGLAGGTDGKIIIVHNVGANNIVLVDESASSTAANRFALTANTTIAADAVAILQYDSTSSRWRCVSGGSTGSSGSSDTHELMERIILGIP